MKAFDETYADQDFQRHLDRVRAGWLDSVPRSHQPDLNVEGLRGTLFARVVSAVFGQREAS